MRDADFALRIMSPWLPSVCAGVTCPAAAYALAAALLRGGVSCPIDWDRPPAAAADEAGQGDDMEQMERVHQEA